MDVFERAAQQIELGRKTGSHTGNRLNIYQIAEELAAERIVAAAIKVPNLEYGGDLTITAPPPARHFTLLHGFFELTRGVVQDQQGFITSTGRFVGRKEAHAIAVASGQPMIDHPSRVDGILYSEDLW